MEREEREREIVSKQESRKDAGCRCDVLRMTGVIVILDASCTLRPACRPKENKNSHNKPPLLLLRRSILLLHPILGGKEEEE
jgi:hypothetical protein